LEASVIMNKVNENRQGYKETKVGWIPNDWACVNYSEVFSRVSLKVDVEPSKIYREIGIRSHGKGIFHKPEVSGESLGNKRVFNIYVGALVFNIVFAWEQAVALISNQEHGFIASHRFPMYVGKKDKACESYFHRFFLTPRGKYLLNLASPGGAGRNKTLGQKELNELKLPLPPFSEQKKIAEILSTWDKAIEKLEKLIELKEKRKKGLMQQLLTGKKRLPGFGKLVNNDREVPEGWRRIKLGNLGKFSKGNGITKKELVDSGTPCILYGQLYTKYSFTIEDFYSYVDPDTLASPKIVLYGDILFAGSGETSEEIGKSAVLQSNRNALAGGDIIIYSEHEQNPLFMGYLLDSHTELNKKIVMDKGNLWFIYIQET
jgi:type I restriction enzyme, S subunit